MAATRQEVGFCEQYNPDFCNLPYEQWDEKIAALHKEAYEKWMKLPEVAALNPPNWEEFLKKPIFHWKAEPYYTYKKDMETGGTPSREQSQAKLSSLTRSWPKVRIHGHSRLRFWQWQREEQD